MAASHLVVADGDLSGYMRLAWVTLAVVAALVAVAFVFRAVTMRLPDEQDLAVASITSLNAGVLTTQRTQSWATAQPVAHGDAIAFKASLTDPLHLLHAASLNASGMHYLRLADGLQIGDRLNSAAQSGEPLLVSLHHRRVVAIQTSDRRTVLPLSEYAASLQVRQRHNLKYAAAALATAVLFGAVAYATRRRTR